MQLWIAYARITQQLHLPIYSVNVDGVDCPIAVAPEELMIPEKPLCEIEGMVGGAGLEPATFSV